MAVAGALSPSITVVVLAILMNPDRPRTRALAFWFGAVLSMLFWALLVSSAMWGLVTQTEQDFEHFGHRIDFVLGLALLIFAVWRIFRKSQHHEHANRYSKDLDSGPLRYQVLFGAVMQGRNVTSVLLFCAAQQHIDYSKTLFWQEGLLTMSMIGIMTASIWLPIALPIRATDTLHTRLTPAKSWLAAHTEVIEVSAAFIGSAYLFYRALLPT